MFIVRNSLNGTILTTGKEMIDLFETVEEARAYTEEVCKRCGAAYIPSSYTVEDISNNKDK